MSETFYPPFAWHLTYYEARVLNALLLAKSTATKFWLMETLYGPEDDCTPDTKILDVYVCKLRRKLRSRFGADAILTEWGKGYRIEEEMKAAIRTHSAPPIQEQAA